MPKDSTIYDIYAGAGKAEGEYEAEWTGIGSIWGDIDWREKKSLERTTQIDTTTDTLQAMLETGSTVYEGAMSAKEFKDVKLPAMQKIAAEEAFKGKGITEKTLRAMGVKDPKKQTLFQQYVATTEGKEWYGGFAPKEVGMTGKSWEDLSGVEKLMQKKMYRFGEGKEAYTVGRAEILGETGFEKYGGRPDLGKYQKVSPEIAEIDRGETEVERLKLDKSKDDLLRQLDTESKKGYEEYVGRRGDAVTLKLKGGDYTQQLDPDTAESVLKAAPNLWEKVGGEESGGTFEMPSLLDEASMEYLGKKKPEKISRYQRPSGTGGGRRY